MFSHHVNNVEQFLV